MFPAEGAEDAGDCEVVDVVASHVFVGTGLPKTWLGNGIDVSPNPKC